MSHLWDTVRRCRFEPTLVVGVGRWGFSPGGFFVGDREGGVVMEPLYFPVMTVSPQSIEVVDAVVAVPVGLIIIGILGWRERIRISRWLGVHGDDVQS